jgi:hypothetical protein
MQVPFEVISQEIVKFLNPYALERLCKLIPDLNVDYSWKKLKKTRSIDSVDFCDLFFTIKEQVFSIYERSCISCKEREVYCKYSGLLNAYLCKTCENDPKKDFQHISKTEAKKVYNLSQEQLEKIPGLLYNRNKHVYLKKHIKEFVDLNQELKQRFERRNLIVLKKRQNRNDRELYIQEILKVLEPKKEINLKFLDYILCTFVTNGTINGSKRRILLRNAIRDSYEFQVICDEVDKRLLNFETCSNCRCNYTNFSFVQLKFFHDRYLSGVETRVSIKEKISIVKFHEEYEKREYIPEPNNMLYFIMIAQIFHQKDNKLINLRGFNVDIIGKVMVEMAHELEKTDLLYMSAKLGCWSLWLDKNEEIYEKIIELFCIN